jgi:uncharacterized protein
MGQTPPVPPGRRLIDGYGGGLFRIGGETHRGAILVLPEHVVPWDVGAVGDTIPTSAITAASLTPITALSPTPEILLIGFGRSAAMIDPKLRQTLRDAGIVVDAMGTGAACRTFNVLLGEGRRVAAALFAVD